MWVLCGFHGGFLCVFHGASEMHLSVYVCGCLDI